jgi:hypothetical protein
MNGIQLNVVVQFKLLFRSLAFCFILSGILLNVMLLNVVSPSGQFVACRGNVERELGRFEKGVYVAINNSFSRIFTPMAT